ncbi:hypothetical protein M427DRAFT_63892 [Gonapodya prolifera JEL478]|uniref:Zn(2)-C6 fungal-type domain-containing protein n=1 Tax=Gonapodya prolifera (strain JEL478) TaxID=1344416 RepID=A0A138ZYG7_GONPJ|nr:hypothetical protein M427DRAFT_63892 [Gonapodya prolifera JEL478]|eukprot:KXS09511.1 hypothetical protein M427DRAFT_63892 [Gonapodya prolifera JEL478]
MQEDGFSEEERQEEAKKRRTSKACDACNSKHDRCDGGEPCSKCKERKLVCSYERLRIGPGPRRGWLEQLKTRFITVEASLLDAMDEIMEIVLPGKFQRDPIPDRGNSKPRDVIDGVLQNLEVTVYAFREEVRKAHAAMGQSTTIMTSSSTVPQEATSLEPNFTPVEHSGDSLMPSFGAGLSLPDGVWALEDGSVDTMTNGFSPLMTGSAMDLDALSAMSTLLRPVELFADLEPLPRPDVMNSYVIQYFDYTWKYRFTRTLNPIHRPTFLSTIAKQSPLLLFAVLTIGAYSSQDNAVASRRASAAFFNRCTRILQEMPENVANDVSFIQALVLMCQYTSGYGSDIARKLMQLANTKSRELSLFSDPSMQPDHCIQEIPGSPEWIKEEERRRTGWALFGADRIGCFISTLPPLLPDEELNLQPPASDEIWESDPSSSPSAALLRNPFACPVASIGPLEPIYIIGHARTLRDRDWTQEHPVVTEFERILSAWYKVFSEDAKPELTPTTARALLLYHSTFVALHSPQDCFSGDPTWLASASFRTALEHALAVRIILQRFLGCGIFLSPFPLHCIYQCATIWLCNITRGGETSKADVRMAIQELEYYSPWWPEALRLGTELERMYVAVTSLCA